MALIDCSECGNKISNLAMACPKCGYPTNGEGEASTPSIPQKSERDRKSHGFLYYVLWIVGVPLALFFGSAIIAGILDSNKKYAIANDPNAIHAEDVVSMMESSYGCEFPNTFSKAMSHRNAGELTAWAEIINDEPYCFFGKNLKSNQKWTVLQVRENMMQISQATPSQVAADSSRYGHKYWTLVEWSMKEKPE